MHFLIADHGRHNINPVLMPCGAELPQKPSREIVRGAYLILVDEVRKCEENSASRHDERADHRVHEAHHQHQEKSRVHLKVSSVFTRNTKKKYKSSGNFFAANKGRVRSGFCIPKSAQTITPTGGEGVEHTKREQEAQLVAETGTPTRFLANS